MGTNITQSPSVAAARAPSRDRLDSVDMLRGLVIIIMALDHVRDYFSDRLFLDPVDLKTTTPAIFLTRWITHYCAPTFMFLAGTGAFLSGTRGKTKPELSWFLFSRGLWLAFLEVTVIRMEWMFNFDVYRHGAGVFWAIGWSMVVLSVLVYLPTVLVAAFGLAMIASHNLLDGKTAAEVHLPEWLWMVLHRPGEASLGGPFTFGTGYCLVPWMGVMAAGYAFGALLQFDRPVRRRLLFLLGAAVTLAFIGLRAVNTYGDPPQRSTMQNWGTSAADILSVVAQGRQPIGAGPGAYVLGVAEVVRTAEPSGLLWSTLAFLNCTKYPPSLLYLLMTLGPAILALAFFDRPLGPLAQPVITFGRVPMFFYLLHIPLIHGGAVLYDYLRFGWSPLAGNGPWFRPEDAPANYGVSLPVVYLLWIAVILILYWPCRWFAGVKRRHPGGFLSYL
jgi:uncharacterized membrane protein